MKTFAERLKHYMQKANMKQADLVEKTQINKSSISEYLSGNYEPKQRNIYKIATALGIKPSQLMGISSTTETPTSALILTHQENELIKKYRQLDADGKDRIDRQIAFELFQLDQSAEKEEQRLG